MGIAAYNRGTKVLARDLASRLPAAHRRADRAAAQDQEARLQAQIAVLERDLARARLCIAELRRSKEARLSEARHALATSHAAIRILTRLAFPHEAPPPP